MNIDIGNDITNRKFKIPNKIDFSLIENIIPIIPTTGQIKIVLNPNGFNSVNLENISIGII